MQWWESLEVWWQLAISFPAFAVLTFLLNIGPFYQPLGRSIFYGLFEGGVLAGLLAVAAAHPNRAKWLAAEAEAKGK